MSTIVAVLSVYIFIVLGYIAKRIFRDQIDEKTLVLISIYFLQPMLVFWGLTSAPIDLELLKVPLVYISIVFVTLFFTYFISKFLFSDIRDSSIFAVSALIGNTGNLGIPLGIALFGSESLIYTSMINIINVLFIYTVGIYFYARGHYGLADAIKSMLKIPIIWASLLGIAFNISEIELSSHISKALQMGGYATMVIQLMIFGIYLYSVKLKEINIKLNISVIFVKAIFIPLIGLISLLSIGYDNYIGAIIFMQLLMPLAVNNVNISALYNCKPVQMASIVFFTSLVFLLLIGVYNVIIGQYFV